MDKSGSWPQTWKHVPPWPAAGIGATKERERNMRTIRLRVSVLAMALLALAISIAPMLAQEARPPTGRVAYHFVSRLLQSPSGTFFVIGYVNFLDGVSAPLFGGVPGENTAFMTFRSDLISAAPLVNGNVVVLNWPATPAPVVKFYLNNSPNGDWNQPDSFSSGQLIGSFSARVGQVAITGSTAVVTFSNDWVWTRDFILGGKMFNLGYLSPGGGTISNYTSAVPVSTTVPGFPTALPSAGTSFAIGQSARTGECPLDFQKVYEPVGRAIAGRVPGREREAHTAWNRVLLLGAAGEQEENGLGASPGGPARSRPKMCPELLGQGSRPSLPSAVVRRRTDEDPPARLLLLPGGRAHPSVPEGDDHAIRRDCSRKPPKADPPRLPAKIEQPPRR